jgi:hypothetical protein
VNATFPHRDGATFLNGKARVVNEIIAERRRQDEKHPDTVNFPDGTGGQALKELSMIARLQCDEAVDRGTCTWRHVLTEEVSEAYAESDPELLRAELVQVAAVAMRWVEALDARADQGVIPL